MVPVVAAFCCCLAVVCWWWRADAPGRRLACLESCAGAGWHAPLSLALAFLGVAIRQGSSIPHALLVVAQVLPDTYGQVLPCVAEALLRGVPWDEAWNSAPVAVPPEDLRVMRGVLESAWIDGTSPLPQIEATLEQLDTRTRMELERNASRLTVKLLMPTGLCFLPAFLCIAVVPTIASFLMH